jgi:hypothetical protein
MADTIIITVAPAPRGAFDAWVRESHICRSRTPFLTGARVLLANGTPPDTVLLMRHAGSDMIALRSTVGAAAALSVGEGDRLPTFRPFEPFNRRADPGKP